MGKIIVIVSYCCTLLWRHHFLHEARELKTASCSVDNSLILYKLFEISGVFFPSSFSPVHSYFLCMLDWLNVRRKYIINLCIFVALSEAEVWICSTWTIHLVEPWLLHAKEVESNCIFDLRLFSFFPLHCGKQDTVEWLNFNKLI